MFWALVFSEVLLCWRPKTSSPDLRSSSVADVEFAEYRCLTKIHQPLRPLTSEETHRSWWRPRLWSGVGFIHVRPALINARSKRGLQRKPTLPLLSLVLILGGDFGTWPPKLLTEKQLAPLCFVLPLINRASSED